jgi:hypothetical protein
MQSFDTWEHGSLAQWCMYQNKVTLIGFLGSNAEVRTNSDRSFTTLSLATKSSYKKDDEYISHTDGTVASFSASSRSGLRRGELAGLKWEDFDFNKLHVTVTGSLVDHHVGPVKTETSRKLIPNDEFVARELLAWHAVTPYKKPSDYVWATHANRACAKRGKQPVWLSTVVRDYIQPTARKLDIQKKMSWHTFRHYAEFRTMPNWLVPLWRESGESAGTPFCYSARFGIVRYTSQVLKEAQQLIIRAVRSSLSFDGCSLGEHLFFQSKIGIEVDLGCLD